MYSSTLCTRIQMEGAAHILSNYAPSQPLPSPPHPARRPSLPSQRAQLQTTLHTDLVRELGPNLGGGTGVVYPTFTHLDALAAAVGNAEYLTTTAIAAHARAMEAPHTTAAPAAAVGAAAIVAAAEPHGGRLTEATWQSVADLFRAYEERGEALRTRERLQAEAFFAMRGWEASGRPAGLGGSVPVFAQYAQPVAAPLTECFAADGV